MAIAVGALVASAGAVAQPARSEPSLSASPGSDALKLDAALARLGRNPRDTATLIEAGEAALSSGDIEAAIGFFKRADQVSPSNPRALSGLARAMLRNNDPVDAIPTFARAEAAGAADLRTTSDRGLAYDLVGDNARARQYYRQALSLGSDVETMRRFSLNQAMTGDGAGAEATLRPLLQAQDKAAWRTRAFVFAILGQVDEAVTVARTLLPADLAAAITPYLRYMPRLTGSQQAAAANFGIFPRASDIGRDDPRIAQYAASIGKGPQVASADRPLIPSGEPLGHRAGPPAEPRAQTKAERAVALAARTAPPELMPTRQTPAEPEVAPPVTARPAYGPPDPGSGRPPVVTATPRAIVAQAQPSASKPSPAQPAPAPLRREPKPAPAAAPAPSLADAFGDIGKPAAGAAQRAGAVDITRIAPSRPKPPPPSHPSRIWVQLGVGRDVDAMTNDWRRLARQSEGVLKARHPFVSDYGSRNRLLTGPFESEEAARGFIQQLDKAGVSGPYIWVSPAGQVVDSLDER